MVRTDGLVRTGLDRLAQILSGPGSNRRTDRIKENGAELKLLYHREIYTAGSPGIMYSSWLALGHRHTTGHTHKY